MQRKNSDARGFVLGFAALVALAGSAPASVLWQESVNGNLSSDGSEPTPLTLAPGANSVIGTVGGAANLQDWVALTVPDGYQLSTIVLAAYVSTDSQGFTGFTEGPGFGGSVFDPSSYLGYAHFGTGAINGALPPTNLIGADLLALMANPALAPGAQGFTPPLDADTYTFLIQQQGQSTSYQFNYSVTPVPGPGAMGLFTLMAATGLGRPRRRSPR